MLDIIHDLFILFMVYLNFTVCWSFFGTFIRANFFFTVCTRTSLYSHTRHHHIQFYVRFICWHVLNGFQKINFQANLSLARSLLTLLSLKSIFITSSYVFFGLPRPEDFRNCRKPVFGSVHLIHGKLSETIYETLHEKYVCSRRSV